MKDPTVENGVAEAHGEHAAAALSRKKGDKSGWGESTARSEKPISLSPSLSSPPDNLLLFHIGHAKLESSQQQEGWTMQSLHLCNNPP